MPTTDTLIFLCEGTGYESEDNENKMMPSKNATKQSAKKKATGEDDIESVFALQKMPAVTSYSRAKSNFNSITFPSASKNYTTQPQDAGVSFSHTEDGEHKVEVDIHVNGVVTHDSFEIEVSDDGMALKWRRATPLTLFDETIGKENDALRRNGTKAVVLQNAVRKMKGELGLTKKGGTSEYFRKEWQYFKLDVECCPKVSKVIIGKNKGIEINGNVQFNSTIRVILFAKEQYKEDSDDDVVEEVFFGSGGGGGGGSGVQLPPTTATMTIHNRNLRQSKNRSRRDPRQLARRSVLLLVLLSSLSLLLLLVPKRSHVLPPYSNRSTSASTRRRTVVPILQRLRLTTHRMRTTSRPLY